jgi:hypothetical protein
MSMLQSALHVEVCPLIFELLTLLSKYPVTELAG